MGSEVWGVQPVRGSREKKELDALKERKGGFVSIPRGRLTHQWGEENLMGGGTKDNVKNRVLALLKGGTLAMRHRCIAESRSLSTTENRERGEDEKGGEERPHLKGRGPGTG